MADWPTIASLATAGGTLVLAVATFASVRSANRAARTAERSLQAGLRPLLLPTRPDDPPLKILWQDRHKATLEGGRGTVEELDGVIYLAASVRNSGAGIAVLHSWYPTVGEPAATDRPVSIDQFRRLTRDLYIPAHDVGFWQGAIREPDDPHRWDVSRAIAQRERISIDLLYGDHEGGQRTITRLTFTPFDGGVWAATIGRYWHIDGREPR
jgi:hypothetical protein